MKKISTLPFWEVVSCGIPYATKIKSIALFAITFVLLSVNNLSAQAPANDFCGTATPITPTVGSCVNTIGTNVDATDSGIAHPCAAYSGGDVWFSFIAPASGEVIIETSTAGGFTDGGMALYSDCAGTIVECNDDSGPGFFSRIEATLTPGDTYYVAVWEFGNNSFGEFNICVEAVPVANDECAGATPLAVTAGSCVNTTLTNVGATNSGVPFGCGGFDGADVWVSFVAPADGEATITTSDAGDGIDTAIALFESCAATSPIACNDDSGSLYSEINAPVLTPGQTYFVAIKSFGGGTPGAFNICIEGNDVALLPCDDALPVVCDTPITGNTVGAPNEILPFCGTGDGSGGGLWYTFTAPIDGDYKITTCSAATDYDTKVRVYSGACDALVCVGGDDDNSTDPLCTHAFNHSMAEVTLTAGEDYSIIVHGFAGFEGTFELLVVCPVPPLPCDDALPILCDTPVTGNTVGAPIETLGTCGTTDGSGGGLWYTFTAPIDGDYKITTCSAVTDYDTKLRVYSGDCDALVCLDGNDDESADPLCTHSIRHSMVEATLTAGEEYSIIVHGFGGLEGTFELLVVCPVLGCNDPTACNFNSLATVDDGSCELGDWYIPAPNIIGIPMIRSCGPVAGYTYAHQVCAEERFLIDPYCVDTEWDAVCQDQYNACVSNDECPGALPVACDSPVTGNTVGAPAVTTPSCGGTGVFGNAGGLWYSYTAPSDGNYKVTTCSDLTDFDTQVRVYSGDCDALVCLSDNDDNGGLDPLCFHSGLHSMAFAPLTAGEQYYILIFGFGDAEGNFELSVVCDDPCLSDVEGPEVTCGDFTETYFACPTPYGPNTPNGVWAPIPASGIFLSASGGSFTVEVDLNGCVTDDFSSFDEMERTLESSYVEDEIPGCSKTLVNELMIRDACGNIAEERIITKITITDDEVPVINTPAGSLDHVINITDPEVCVADLFATCFFLTYTDDPSKQISVDVEFGGVVYANYPGPSLSDITDNCDIANVYCEFPLYDPAACTSTMDLTWFAQDACGTLSDPFVQHFEFNDLSAPIVDCPDFTETFEGCPAGLGPNTPSGDWFIIPPSGLILTAVGGSYITEVDVNCVSDLCSNVEDLQWALFDSYTLDLVPGWSITIVNELMFRDECGNVSDDHVLVINTIVDTTAPIFEAHDDTVTVECLEDVPPVLDLTAEDCGNIIEAISFESNTGELIKSCALTEALGGIADWSLWLPVLADSSLVSSANFVWDANGGTFDCFADSTGHLYGTVVNDQNANEIFVVDLWFEGNYNWTDWSAAGHLAKDPLNTCTDDHINWNYWKLVDGISNVQGAGDLLGSDLSFYHMPADYTFGFQIGLGANTKNCNFGMSGWFTYTGLLTNQGTTTSVVGNGDVNVDADCETFNTIDCVNFTEFKYLYMAQDNCLNTARTCQVIIVNDTTPPTFTYVGADTTVMCDEWPMPVDSAMAVDNCIGDVTLVMVQDSIPGSCPHEFTITRTWRATDICDNFADSTQTIQVVDTEAPVMSGLPAATGTGASACSNDAVINGELCPGNSLAPGDFVQTFCPDVIGDGTMMSVSFTGGGLDENWDYLNVYDGSDASGTPIATYTGSFEGILIEHTATNPDGCITFEITSDGSWSCGADDFPASRDYLENPIVFNVSCGDTGGAISEIEVQCDDIPEAPVVTATDNCSLPENITIAFSETSTLDADGPCDYYITRTWSATDECTNTSETFTQIIHVIDTVGPVFDPFDIQVYVECDEVMDYTVTAQDCNFEGITYTQILGSWGCSLGSYTRTYTATDSCGNSTTAVQYINIIDTTPPEILGVPADTDMECSDMPTPVGGLYFDLGGVTAIDNCQGAMTVTYAEDSMPGACIDAFVLTRSWSAIDSCGNADTLYQVINVLDTTDPEWDFFPANATYECTDVVPDFMATATDNCDLDVMVTMVADTTFGDCAGYYEITRTFTAVDNCENDIVQAQTIYIIDTTGPDFVTVPANETYECTDIIPEDLATATDECSGPPIITFDDVVTGNSCETLITRTFTATDSCGNASTAIQLITVLDTTPPVFDPYEPEIDMPCDDISTAITVTATDACPSPTITSFDDIDVSGGCAGTIIRTYYATDSCGNVDSIQQILHLIDLVDPTFIDFPGTASYQCLTDVPAPAILAGEDNCDDEPVVTFVGDVSEGTCPTTITRTWRVTDHCDNFTEMSQTIIVDDTIDPEFTLVPEDETLDCLDDVPTTTTAEASDNCTIPVITFEDVAAGNACLRTVTRTFTATDACGNTATATQVFTFVDDTPPTFTSVPADDEYECSDVIPEDLATASDDCNTVLVTFEDVISGDPCIATIITRTFTAADACGNEATAVQTITVVDTTPPVLSVDPEDIEVTCDDEIPDPIEGITAMDNCDDNVIVEYTETVIGHAPTPGADSDCALSTGDNIPNVDWSLVLYDFPNDDSFYATTEAYFVEFPDGSAHLYGHVESTTTTGGWDIDVWFEDKMDWAAWSAILPARSYKDDYNVVGLNYVDWSYYIMSAGATLTGTGDYLGSTLNLTHAPSNYYYGYQVGIGANNVNLEFGNGGWFEATGSIVINGGTPIVLDWPNRISGDFAFDADCCLEYQIVRTYTATDCSGNSASVSYTVDVVESDAAIEGCTDSSACNYNAAADSDDGSCFYPGCTDSTANNYDSTAGCDDGSCTYDALPGCTDSAACNYDPAATIDDGSCEAGEWYIPLPGTIAPITLSCGPLEGYFYADQDCAQEIVDNDPFCVDTEWDNLCQDDYDACLGIFPGCTDTTACNYDSSATEDDGSCIDAGCTDSNANNYDSTAGCDDGSCTYDGVAGCMDTTACNYDSSADTDDGSCTYPGCIDTTANNYDSAAGCDDASCIYPPANDQCEGALEIACGDVLVGSTTDATSNNAPEGCGTTAGAPGVWFTFTGDGSEVTFSTCSDATTYDTKIGVYSGTCDALVCVDGNDDACGLQSSTTALLADGEQFFIYVYGFSTATGDFELSASCLTIVPGCNDTAACNYDSAANTDDGSCTYPGCMDTAAVNYDSTAGCDDGSCAYSAGCMDTTACNFDSSATIDDGSCTFPGCLDTTANNYDSTAGCDDNSLCIYPPLNDLCSGGLEIACGDVLVGSTTAATSNDAPEGCGTTGGAPGVWFTFTGDGSEVTFDLCSDVTDYDTKISVYSGTCDALVCVGGNDDSCGLQSSTTALLADGEEYLVYVYGFGSATGNFELVVTCVTVVPGCTDLGACNYDPAATADDGSCTYPGCLDTSASNFDSTAGCEDNTLCIYNAGCMDTTACNFDSTADSDDGSCTYPGCMDTTANNFDSTAECADNTLCTYPLDLCNETITPIACGDLINGSTIGSTNTPPETCGTTATASGLWYSITGTGEQATFSLCGSLYDTKLHLFSGTCDSYVCVSGNDDACGLQSELTADLADGVEYFLYVSGFGTATGDFVLNVTCIGDIVEGCTDATACNYDSLANTDDGTCIAAGCFDPAAVNFDSGAACENNTLCIYGPDNDLCADAIEVFCGETISGTTVGASEDGNPTDFCGTTPSSGGVWYTFVATGPETTFSTCDAATYDTKINVYSGDCGALVCEGGNDDGPGCAGFSSELTLATTDGVTYTILVNGFNGDSGDFDLTISCGPPVPQLQLEVTALLGGPLNPETLQMNDLIRTEASFPLTDPYTELGYEHVNNEEAKTKAEVLAVDGFDAIVDWVVIELRNGDNPEERIATQAALIQKDGDIVSTDGVSPVIFDNPGGSVMVVIRHRNHLGVCNLEPTILSGDTFETITLDFTDPTLPVLGGEYAMGLVDNVRVLFAGDANSDGSVNPFDKNAHWRVENGGAFDYFDSKSDFNLDGAINPFDKNSKWRLNNGRSEQID